MEYPYHTTKLPLPELTTVTLYTAIFGPITLKENGIEYLYASLSKHLHIHSIVVKGLNMAKYLQMVLHLKLRSRQSNIPMFVQW